MQAAQFRPGKNHAMAVNDEVLRAHFASKRISAKLLCSEQSGVPAVYVSGAGAACFFGLALVLGASRRTGAAFAATFLRSK